MMVHCRNDGNFGKCWLLKPVAVVVSAFAEDAVVSPTVSKASKLRARLSKSNLE
jgi:hypothetical protein